MDQKQSLEGVMGTYLGWDITQGSIVSAGGEGVILILKKEEASLTWAIYFSSTSSQVGIVCKDDWMTAEPQRTGEFHTDSHKYSHRQMMQ